MLLNKKKVSVIIPVYHVEKYLKTCVESILKQTYQNLEVILVDDGGNDGCPEMCDVFASKDARVISIHKENGGQTTARKAGVEISTGDYIMFVDADDWLEAQTIGRCVLEIEKNAADLVCFGYKRIYTHKVFNTSIFDRTRIFSGTEIQYLQRRIVGLVGNELAHVETADRFTPMWGKLYSKKMIQAGKWISEREVGSSEDALFNLYALSECEKCVYINEFMYCYRKTNETATTRKYRSDLINQWSNLFSYFQVFIDENGNDKEFVLALQNRIILSMIGIGLNEIGSSKHLWEKAKYLKVVLNRPLWKTAYSRLKLYYFPFKWKIFFALCKYHKTYLLVLMLEAIDRLKAVVNN
ncbi:hypothetical protein BHF69_05445 [Anaerostipes sp. 992a]|uniref:glycosyltransferase family 2 protein n=1 Tax=Anaerostipes sp. 992a TaxID=1261637 RepID=UPI000953452F|nr:glycosyltransferase family 2 protein [Anaerostipes sp. 992a]OLR62174.1 hypothetical protein BHF69_05445 [Anaerostipes sp. 992a]